MHARQAIETCFLGPTNFRGARIKARADAGQVTIPWDDDLDVVENHAAGAKALLAKLGWDGQWAIGAPPGNGRGYVFVNVSKTSTI